MPELPEVETIRRVLEPQVKGLGISDITANRTDIIAYPSAEIFCEKIKNQTISAMDRRGKFLIIVLESGDKIILHLRMTGCLLVTMHDYPQEKHTHIIFHLSNGSELRFSDTRRFGRFWYIQDHEVDTYSGISKLGMEPSDKNLRAGYLETKGQDYRNTPFLQVYGHDGEACPVCGKILCRTVIGGRSSVYCPGCQRNL